MHLIRPEGSRVHTSDSHFTTLLGNKTIRDPMHVFIELKIVPASSLKICGMHSGKESRPYKTPSLVCTRTPKGMLFGWFFVTKLTKKHSLGCPGRSKSGSFLMLKTQKRCFSQGLPEPVVSQKSIEMRRPSQKFWIIPRKVANFMSSILNPLFSCLGFPFHVPFSLSFCLLVLHCFLLLSLPFPGYFLVLLFFLFLESSSFTLPFVFPSPLSSLMT